MRKTGQLFWYASILRCFEATDLDPVAHNKTESMH